VLLQLSDKVIVSETEHDTGDASNYQYYEWSKNLTVPAVQMSDETTYKCSARIGRMSGHAIYSFTVVGICLHLLIIIIMLIVVIIIIMCHRLLLLCLKVDEDFTIQQRVDGSMNLGLYPRLVVAFLPKTTFCVNRFIHIVTLHHHHHMFFIMKLTHTTYYTHKKDSETENVFLCIQTMKFKNM